MHKTFWKNDLNSLPKKEKPAKIRKPLRPFGKRTKERIAKYGSESEFFVKEIWEKRNHECEQCGKRLGKEPKNHNFDHVIAKSRDESKRYDPNNIMLICYSCHHEKTFGGKYKGLDAVNTPF